MLSVSIHQFISGFLRFVLEVVWNGTLFISKVTLWVACGAKKVMHTRVYSEFRPRCANFNAKCKISRNCAFLGFLNFNVYANGNGLREPIIIIHNIFFLLCFPEIWHCCLAHSDWCVFLWCLWFEADFWVFCGHKSGVVLLFIRSLLFQVKQWIAFVCFLHSKHVYSTWMGYNNSNGQKECSLEWIQFNYIFG